MRKPVYIRDNIFPVFISERTPNKNREDLWQLLEKVGMNHLSQLEWLIHTPMRYSGDRFYVRRISADDEMHCIEFGEPEKTERAIIAAEIEFKSMPPKQTKYSANFGAAS